jgi:hypothetical protein
MIWQRHCADRRLCDTQLSGSENESTEQARTRGCVSSATSAIHTLLILFKAKMSRVLVVLGIDTYHFWTKRSWWGWWKKPFVKTTRATNDNPGTCIQHKITPHTPLPRLSTKPVVYPLYVRGRRSSILPGLRPGKLIGKWWWNCKSPLSLEGKLLPWLKSAIDSLGSAQAQLENSILWHIIQDLSRVGYHSSSIGYRSMRDHLVSNLKYKYVYDYFSSHLLKRAAESLVQNQ